MSKAKYSWKYKTSLAGMEPISVQTQFYHKAVERDTVVDLKGTGGSSRKVTVKPGEHIIFDGDGYAVFVMPAGAFTRQCVNASELVAVGDLLDEEILNDDDPVEPIEVGEDNSDDLILEDLGIVETPTTTKKEAVEITDEEINIEGDQEEQEGFDPTEDAIWITPNTKNEEKEEFDLFKMLFT